MAIDDVSPKITVPQADLVYVFVFQPQATEEKPKAEPARQPTPAPSRRRLAQSQAKADLIEILSTGRIVVSQQTLVERWGVARSTVSDWLRDWTNAGLIPQRRIVGRCKQLSGKRPPAGDVVRIDW